MMNVAEIVHFEIATCSVSTCLTYHQQLANILFDGVELSKVDARHWIQSIASRGWRYSDGLQHTPFSPHHLSKKGLRFVPPSVNDGVVLLDNSRLCNSLIAVGLNGDTDAVAV